MPLLFGNARCFVFPSRLEACGTVLIEALACGTPILCNRIRPLTDICGEAAVFFDGEDPGDIADKLLEVLGDRALREKLASQGPARAAHFSWRQGAEKMYQVFEELRTDTARRGTAAPDHERRT